MVDQLTNMERIATTPIPISCGYYCGVSPFILTLLGHRCYPLEAMRYSVPIFPPVYPGSRPVMEHDPHRHCCRVYTHGN